MSTGSPVEHIVSKSQALIAQVNAVRGELLVISGAAGFPHRTLSGVRGFHFPGASVFECRAFAPSLAASDIIALTEDHCTPSGDWCARILNHFEGRPELVLLGGAVVNGSNNRIEDIMNYWMTFATYAPGQVTARAPCIAQYAFRKSAIATNLRPGDLESQVISDFAKVPGAICVDPEMQVTHVQSHGFWGTVAAHYHNGRACAGLFPAPKAGHITAHRALSWTYTQLKGHLRHTGRAFAAGKNSVIVRAGYLVLIMPLIFAHGFGQVMGYLKGPGKSPSRVA